MTFQHLLLRTAWSKEQRRRRHDRGGVRVEPEQLAAIAVDEANQSHGVRVFVVVVVTRPFTLGVSCPRAGPKRLEIYRPMRRDQCRGKTFPLLFVFRTPLALLRKVTP